jgi:DNA-binding protein HU-beta
MAQMLRVTQTGSTIGRTQDQRATVRSLGLRRIRHTVVQPDRPEIRGMIRKVSHLVTFEEITAAEAEAFRAQIEAGRAPREAPAGPRAKHVARGAWRAAAEEQRTTKVRRGSAAGAEAGEDAEAPSGTAPVTTAAKKPAAKKTAAKKAPAKKTPVKKAAAKKAPAERSAAKKTAAKKTAAKKAPAKKTAAKKRTTKKSEG